MKTLAIDHIRVNEETREILIACGIRRFSVETINDTGYERLLLMPQTGDKTQLTLDDPDAEGNDVNAVIEYADDPDNNKHGVMCSVVQLPSAVKLTPEPMSILTAVGFYRMLDNEGKAGFVEVFQSR